MNSVLRPADAMKEMKLTSRGEHDKSQNVKKTKCKVRRKLKPIMIKEKCK